MTKTHAGSCEHRLFMPDVARRPSSGTFGVEWVQENLEYFVAMKLTIPRLIHSRFHPTGGFFPCIDDGLEG